MLGEPPIRPPKKLSTADVCQKYTAQQGKSKGTKVLKLQTISANCPGDYVAQISL